jgi:LacI family transcriptional regulator
MATQYLIGKGHTNIALVTGSIRKDGVMEKRFLGYKRALKEAGLFYDPDHVFEDSVSYEYGQEAGREIAGKREITAVFAVSDMVALGVISGLAEAGRAVPDDVSVIGFDDIFVARMCNPPLTTIRQDIVGRGAMAAQRLLHTIADTGKKLPPEPTVMPLSLVERDTVRRLP